MTKQVEYTGHTATSGGLQGHSLGETYPLTVVGLDSRAVGVDQVRYYIKNLSTGRVLALRGRVTPMFLPCQTAHDVCHILATATFPKTWAPTEPAVRAGVTQFMLRLEDQTQMIELEGY